MVVALGPISIRRLSQRLVEYPPVRKQTRTSIRKEDRKMTWLLLNLLVAAPFFAIWVGVPLWLVLKHPDQDHRPQAPSGPARSHRVEPPNRNPRSSSDAASTRPAQTGWAGNRTALEHSSAIDCRRLHQTASGH
jgi:hypothetical protein